MEPSIKDIIYNHLDEVGQETISTSAQLYGQLISKGYSVSPKSVSSYLSQYRSKKTKRFLPVENFIQKLYNIYESAELYSELERLKKIVEIAQMEAE